MNRRQFILTLPMLAAAGIPAAHAAGPKVTVIKAATCGCCSVWVDHMKAAGFDVTAENVEDLYERKDKMKIPAELQSCHTGTVEGYVIEGHVPAADVQRLLKEKPAALGLAVPGMPMGSPGMDMGPKKDPYKVILFTEDGKQSVWNEYKGN